ncbi:hypothetical protein ITP53_55185, partial [Nonomuraea sp. K274]
MWMRGEAGDGLIDRFLAREHGQWARVWPAGQEPLDDVTARQAVAVVTLTAPTTAELPGLLTTVPALRGGTPGATRIRTQHMAAWLETIFPGDDQPLPDLADQPMPKPATDPLTPLGPDLVAERLLAGTDELGALVLAVHDHEGRTTRHLVRMLDILRSSSSREPVRSALRSLVTRRIGSLVAEAAEAPGTRLGDALNAAVTLFTADRRLAEAAAALPVRRDARLGLRALDVTLGELAVRHLRARREPLALAWALSVLSARLVAVGRVGEAVVAAAESADLFAAAPPYEDAAGHAEALYDLSACLLFAGESGRALRPAQEAAARYRILAEEDPRHTEQAARAHHNLACALLEADRLYEAVAAFAASGGDPDVAANLTDILSVLPDPTPDRPAHLPQRTADRPTPLP